MGCGSSGKAGIAGRARPGLPMASASTSSGDAIACDTTAHDQRTARALSRKNRSILAIGLC
jgi:hypothetical protein